MSDHPNAVNQEKLRILLPHWIEHNSEHAEEFREWAERAGDAEEPILAAADMVEEANRRLEEALQALGGSLDQHHHEHAHD